MTRNNLKKIEFQIRNKKNSSRVCPSLFLKILILLTKNEKFVKRISILPKTPQLPAIYKNFHSKSFLAYYCVSSLAFFHTHIYTHAKSENHPTASQLNSYFTSILVKELNSDYDGATSNKNSRITVVEFEKREPPDRILIARGSNNESLWTEKEIRRGRRGGWLNV